jgi:protein AroM
MSHRFAFVTIGQTPRTDLVPELLALLPKDVTVEEFGALDGLDDEPIAALTPGSEEPRLVTRLRDGRQVVLRKAWVQERLQEILGRIDAEVFRATVLLCTGEFPGLAGPGLFVDAQHLVDHGTAALSAGASRLGVMLPLAQQARDFHLQPAVGQELLFSHASPYEGDRFAAAARDLAAADLIVMHCMGYTEAHRERVAQVSGRPVLLARRLVATGLINLL